SLFPEPIPALPARHLFWSNSRAHPAPCHMHRRQGTAPRVPTSRPSWSPDAPPCNLRAPTSSMAGDRQEWSLPRRTLMISAAWSHAEQSVRTLAREDRAADLGSDQQELAFSGHALDRRALLDPHKGWNAELPRKHCHKNSLHLGSHFVKLFLGERDQLRWVAPLPLLYRRNRIPVVLLRNA